MKSSQTPSQPTHDQPQVAAAKLPGAFALFKPSWQAFKLNFWTFVLGGVFLGLVLIIPLLIAFAGTVSTDINLRASGSTSSVSTTAFNVTSIVIGVMVILLAITIFLPYYYLLKLQSAKGVKVTFGVTFKRCLHYYWRLLGLYICRFLVILAGLVLLIVPGLFIWRRYMLAPFYLVDEDIGVFEAMKKSAADSKPFSSAIWGMIGIYILLNVLGIVPFIVIPLVATVLSIAYCCAQAVRYLQIKSAKT